MVSPWAATEVGFEPMITVGMSTSAGIPMKRAKLCIFVPPWKSVPDRCLVRCRVEVGVAFRILVFSYRMMSKLQNANRVMVRLFRFLLLVLRDFKRNQGLLLPGAGASYH